MASEFMPIGELAKLTGVSRPTMVSILKKGDGPKHYKLPSGVARVTRVDAEAWLLQLKNADKAVRGALGWK